MLVAAVTDRLVDFAVNVVGDLGLWGIFILMVPESALIPIPSEATMLIAGVNACLAAGFESFVHTGTSSEYGTKDHAPAETEWIEPTAAAAALLMRRPRK